MRLEKQAPLSPGAGQGVRPERGCTDAIGQHLREGQALKD